MKGRQTITLSRAHCEEIEIKFYFVQVAMLEANACKVAYITFSPGHTIHIFMLLKKEGTTDNNEEIPCKTFV
jgi:hypothetical protein